MNNSIYDLLIIGGGINGTAIAADAAGRGLAIILCEQNDLASGTSWASSKLIHGGLRYLEHYDFKMVRIALKEREILLTRAPHLVRPLEFILPISKITRPSWLISAGLYLYDHLARRQILPASHKLKLQHSIYGAPLQANFSKGYSYYDCLADDTRLVIANALSAKQHGATILTRHQVMSATTDGKIWQVNILDKNAGHEKTIFAKAVINASGPWINQIIKHFAFQSSTPCSLVKGSHIIIRKFYSGDQAYLLQNPDKRIIFVIPYLNDYLLIGTTDVLHQDEVNEPSITPEEIHYLIASVNAYFIKTISEEDIIKTYSGIRALASENDAKPHTISRDYKLDLNKGYQTTPLLNVFGGKLTTHRHLAESALKLLKPYFPMMKENWTSKSPLPGGDFDHLNWQQFLTSNINKYPWLPVALVTRYATYYGSLMDMMLEGSSAIADLGTHFGSGLFQREVDYLVEHEWAQTSDDILWRRTKLGLFVSDETRERLEEYLGK